MRGTQPCTGRGSVCVLFKLATRAAPGPGDSITEREAGVKNAAKDSDEAKRIVVVHMKRLLHRPNIPPSLNTQKH